MYGRFFGSKCEAGSQKCCKNLANARLDLRNAANSLQIEGKGVLPGDPYHGGVGTRNTRPYINIIYIYAITCIEMIVFISTPRFLPKLNAHVSCCGCLHTTSCHIQLCSWKSAHLRAELPHLPLFPREKQDPRTRMQSRKALLRNKCKCMDYISAAWYMRPLFPYQCRLWRVEWGGSAEWGVWSVEYKKWSVACRDVYSVKCGVWSVDCRV